jgi:hypothetical protein
MIKWILLLCCLLPLTGCKLVASIGIQKDWSVQGHPLNSGIYRPDMRTNAELRLEKDWK